MIQLSLEAILIKKKEKRTLITFFSKKNLTSFKTYLQELIQKKFQVLKVPRSCSYKKRKRKRTLVTFFLNEEPYRLKLTKRYISNPRDRFYKKKKEGEMEENERERGKREGKERKERGKGKRE